MTDIQTTSGQTDADIKNKFSHFFKELDFRLNLFQTYKQSFDKYLASEFNVFQYILPNENRLSDIIADLLDPNGKHGQKEIFLKEFLEIIGKSGKCDASKGKIIREKTTDYILNSQRRIDIIIDFGDFGIGIENKPWAIDQKDQLKEYNQHLMKKYKDSYLLIYLTASGSDPDSLSISEIEVLKKQEKFLTIAYPDKFNSWLESCYKQSDSEKVRLFLKDFIKYVDLEFRPAQQITD
jgi:hypothetical protein